MTKREMWLKLFQENNTALATAIHLCERFVTLEGLEKNEEFIRELPTTEVAGFRLPLAVVSFPT